MVCYHPLKGFPIGLTDSNKTKYKITSYNTNHVEFYNNTWYDVNNLGVSPFCEKAVKDFIEVPCGQCKGCRLDYSRQWADRCMLEMSTTSDKKYYETYFLTLTYDDEHLPSSTTVDENGEVLVVHSLVKRDLQLFMKDLREEFYRREKKKDSSVVREDVKLKFFAAGEYGDLSFRPHYHIILFGISFDDLVFYKRSELGFDYSNSPWLDKIWKKGFCVIAPASWETCAYTARYVMKKWKGKDASMMYGDWCLEPEFSLMSRRPGIGKDYIDQYGVQDWFELEKHFLNGRTINHNRYFEKILQKVDPERLLDLKKVNQEVMLANQILKLKKTSNSYLKMLSIEEDSLNSRIKTLVRKEI